jgi:hypothetical protein
VERRGPEPALRGGGSMKLAARGASVRCGGSYALPFVHEVVLSWWTAIFSQGVHRAGSGYAFGCRNFPLGRCRGLPSPFLVELFPGENHILLNKR